MEIKRSVQISVVFQFIYFVLVLYLVAHMTSHNYLCIIASAFDFGVGLSTTTSHVILTQSTVIEVRFFFFWVI